MNSKILIGGLLAGVAVGVAVGLLLSPATSQAAKQKIKKGARMLTDSLGGIENLRGRFNEGVDEVAREGKRVINSTSERVKV